MLSRLFALLATALAAALAASPSLADPRILVLAKHSQLLQSFDAASHAKQFEVQLKGEPHEVVASPDGRFAYAVDYSGLVNTVSVVDLEKHAVAATIDLKPSYKPHGMAITRDGKRLFVTCEASRVIAEVSLAENKVSRTFPLRDWSAHLLALSPDQETIYVTSIDAGNVSFVDVASGKVTYSVVSGKGAEGVDVTPDGREVWVVNRVFQTLGIVDVATHQRVTTVACEGNPIRIKFSPNGKIAVVTCALTGHLAFFDRATRKEIGRAESGIFPLGVVFDPTGARCFVTDSRNAEVVVIDTATRKPTGRFKVGADPEGIAFLP